MNNQSQPRRESKSGLTIETPTVSTQVGDEVNLSGGTGSSRKSRPAHRGGASVEASWQLPDGGSVLFSGPSHRLVLIGKDGGALETEIRDSD